MVLAGLLLIPFLCGTEAQQVGNIKKEKHPFLKLHQCTEDGCTAHHLGFTVDANYRWLHGATKHVYQNCLEGGHWKSDLCPDPKKCAEQCAVDGVDLDGYEKRFGITVSGSGINIQFGETESFAKRVFVIDEHDEDSYQLFKLKNREFSFDVDASNLPCGLNGGVSFVAMGAKGEQGMGANAAGAKYGMGYCDAKCPRSLRFVQGEANMDGWESVRNEGRYGSCCAEVNLWEANRNATAMTAHACKTKKQTRCEGDACGASCDGSGCQFNPFQLGSGDFYGPGAAGLDTTRPLTVVTQFLTSDGTDTGDLVEIRRFYSQEYDVIQNANASVQRFPRIKGNSITDTFCKRYAEATGRGDFFEGKASYLEELGDALERGMVLVLSLQDEPATNLNWLDSSPRPNKVTAKNDIMEGPCFGRPRDVRSEHPEASVQYSNFRFGAIGHTWKHPPPKPTTTPTPSILKRGFDGVAGESAYLSTRPRLMWTCVGVGSGIAAVAAAAGLLGCLWAQGFRCSCCGQVPESPKTTKARAPLVSQRPW